MSSWDHEVYRLPAEVIDRGDRFGAKCGAGKCAELPTHAVRWTYITGRSGRVSYTVRRVCTGHGERFAVKHHLTVGDPRPEQPSQYTAALEAFGLGVAGPVQHVRVYLSRSAQWYLQKHRAGGGLLATSNQWLPGVRGAEPLARAIVEAETVLAQTTLVPAAPWQHPTSNEACVDVAPAWRTDGWFFQPWRLRIACNDAGMWQLTRTLDQLFQPQVTDLGDHNMTVERAVKVADDLLQRQRWVPSNSDWSTYPDGTAEQDAWHPDQVDPSTWQNAPHAGDNSGSTDSEGAA